MVACDLCAPGGRLRHGRQLVTAAPSGLPELTSRGKLSAELEKRCRSTHAPPDGAPFPLFTELGATDAAVLLQAAELHGES